MQGNFKPRLDLLQYDSMFDLALKRCNRIYQILQGLESRKNIVIEQKRNVVAKSEEKFQAEVYKLTTDDDMPAYSGFEFSA